MSPHLEALLPSSESAAAKIVAAKIENAEEVAAKVADDAMWDAYNLLSLGPDVERMRKLLVRYDLFKQVCRSSCQHYMFSYAAKG